MKINFQIVVAHIMKSSFNSKNAKLSKIIDDMIIIISEPNIIKI